MAEAHLEKIHHGGIAGAILIHGPSKQWPNHDHWHLKVYLWKWEYEFSLNPPKSAFEEPEKDDVT